MKRYLFLIWMLVIALTLNNVTALEPMSYSSKGIELNTFPTDMAVYVFYNATVYCEGVLENTELDVYITPDVNWEDGTGMAGSIYQTTVTTDSNGKLKPTLIWEHPEVGEYDIAIDLNGNGVYDVGGLCTELVDGESTTGFTVIKATQTTEEVEEKNESSVLNETVSETAEKSVVMEETEPAEKGEFDYVPFIIVFVAAIIAGIIIAITLIKIR